MPKKEKKEVAQTKATKTEKKENKVKSVKKDKKEKNNSIKSIRAELKKVTWPTPKQLVNKTIAVIAIVLIVSIIVFLFDLIFENIYNLGTGALKSIITTSEENVSDTTVGDTTDVADTTESHEGHDHE